MKANLFFIIMFIMATTSYSNANAAKHIGLTGQEVKKNRDHKTNDLYKSFLEQSAYRNEVLAQNLANVNTPGYKADEVYMPNNFNDLSGNSGASKAVTMANTSPKHITKHKENQGKFRKSKLKDPDEIKKNGNNVSLRQQMTKLSQNKTDYTAAVKGYATINSLFSAVIGK